jgi:hypothetical protein
MVGPWGSRKRGIDWSDWREAIVGRFEDGGAAQMRESDGWRNEDLRDHRRKIGPARGIVFSPRATISYNQVKTIH